MLQSTSSRHAGFSSCGTRALEHRLSSCGTRAQLLRGMWDLPGPGIEPVSPTLAGRYLTIAPQGKSPFLQILIASGIQTLQCLCFFFWPCQMACRILIPQPGIEPMLPAVEAQSPNHWTTREVPCLYILNRLLSRTDLENCLSYFLCLTSHTKT